jgi:RNA polymerase sigma-70 factor (sigma-E family)
MNQRRAEFDRFVAGITGTLLRTAYLIVWDLGEAEDLVQETLLEVARRWPRVRRMERPAAYARRILINRALSGAGRRARRRRELAAEPPPDRVTVTDDGAVIDGHDELMAALAALPPRQRAVLVLRYFLDLPEAEVAAALKCSPRHRQEHRRSWTRATRAGARHDQRDKEHPDMNDQLESDLRAALRARAAGVPATAVIRLTGLDYRPRTWGLRPPVAVGALTSPAAAGGLVAIVSLGAPRTRSRAGPRSPPRRRRVRSRRRGPVARRRSPRSPACR